MYITNECTSNQQTRRVRANTNDMREIVNVAEVVALEVARDEVLPVPVPVGLAGVRVLDAAFAADEPVLEGRTTMGVPFCVGGIDVRLLVKSESTSEASNLWKENEGW